jgi:hypothetical protein
MMEEVSEGGKIALLEWDDEDGIAEILGDELVGLGYEPIFINRLQRIPPDVPYLFTYGPYGKLLPFLAQLAEVPAAQRPVSIHWNTEGVPDLRLPWGLVQALGLHRSRLDKFMEKRPFSHIGLGMNRFRYVGDLYFAYRQGWLHVIADSSQIYAKRRSDHGLPTLFAPWGATARWYETLSFERDIDVLWMGNRSSRRRANILDAVRDYLRAQGVRVYMADNEENPFIFDELRIEMLNRAKITLNVTRTWFDDNFSRFALAAPNRSLIVSEKLLPHCPYFEPGVHYVAASVAELGDAILAYLDNEPARQTIVENCYKLITTQLTMRNSIKTMMQAAEARRLRQPTP